MKCASGSPILFGLPILFLLSPWCLAACGEPDPAVPVEGQASPVDLSGPITLEVRSGEVRITADRIDWRWTIASPVPLKVKASSARRIQLIRAGGPADTGKDSAALRGATTIEIHLTAEVVGRKNGFMTIRSEVLVVGEDSVFVKGPAARGLEDSDIRRRVTISELPEALDAPGEHTLYTIGGTPAVLVIL